MEETAGRFEFFATADMKTKFERQPKPVLKYTNPVRGEVYGNVFVWTHQGRPEVIAAVFDYRSARNSTASYTPWRVAGSLLGTTKRNSGSRRKRG